MRECACIRGALTRAAARPRTQRRAPTDYKELMRHLTRTSSKVLSKRWYQARAAGRARAARGLARCVTLRRLTRAVARRQYGNPDDQPNKNRIWR